MSFHVSSYSVDKAGPSLLYAIKRRILDTPTGISQPSNRTIVRPTSELLLHGLRQHRTLDVRIFGYFRSEFLVEIGGVSCIDLA